VSERRGVTEAARHPYLIAFIVSFAFFMQMLDGTIIATALPQMAISFNDTPVNVSIGMTAYLLTLAVFIPISGWMADRFGSRTVFAAAIVTFSIGSILCGSSHNLGQFTAARILQAIGGAMMVPVGRLAVLRIVEKHELIRTTQFITIPGLIAPVLGPPIGGFITTAWSWRWIFYMNVPIGIAGVVMALLFMQNYRGSERRPFDVLGFLLGGAGFGCLMYGLSQISRSDANLPMVLSALAAGVVLGIAAVVHARRFPYPLIDLRTMRIPTFALSTLGGGLLFRLTVWSTPLLWPLMFQNTFGMSAFTSGLLIMWCAAGDVGITAIARPVLRRFGFRNVLLVNGFLCAMANLACIIFTPATPLVVIAAVLLSIGMLRSMQFTSLNALAYVDIPSPLMSSATSFAATMQQLSAGFGVAFGAIVLHLAAQFHGSSPSFTVSDFRVAYVAVALCGLASTVNFLRLAPAAGFEASGHRPVTVS
jgi:EmrB/QacA subfamily drug resistance transporter